jgi:hypothetical protein
MAGLGQAGLQVMTQQRLIFNHQQLHDALLGKIFNRTAMRSPVGANSFAKRPVHSLDLYHQE